MQEGTDLKCWGDPFKVRRGKWQDPKIWVRPCDLIPDMPHPSPCPGHAPSPPVVDTVQGKVLGKYVHMEGFAQPVAVFLGVPFAKPPLGSLRFAPPQPAEPWNFVKNTTTYPPM